MTNAVVSKLSDLSEWAAANTGSTLLVPITEVTEYFNSLEITGTLKGPGSTK